MPFDGTPSQIRPLDTALARMELLQEIAAKTNGCQKDFKTCLWSAVRRSRSLRAAGLSNFDNGHGNMPVDGAARWFGFGPSADPWDGAELSVKRRAIARRLRVLRKKETANAV